MSPIPSRPRSLTPPSPTLEDETVDAVMFCHAASKVMITAAAAATAAALLMTAVPSAHSSELNKWLYVWLES
jgi:hypothetical protein